MRVHVRLFAGTRDAVGRATLDLDVPEGASAADVFARLVADHPRLERYRGAALLALDGAFVPPTTRVRPDATLAIMPPVSGGSGAVDPAPFSLDAMTREAAATGAGAVVAFTGVVRPTSRERPGARVERLHFEAYPEMAEREIETLRAEATAKFGLTACLVRHRTGTLAVGEPIVAVVTAAPHRAAAFEAAMWLMDELKTRVPIWKEEQGPDGSRWVNDA